MDFSERIVWLLVGGIIGFILGYFVRTLREIKEKVDEVDEIIKGSRTQDRIQGEDGFMYSKLIRNLALAFVVLLTAWAAFESQKASNDVKSSYQKGLASRCAASVDNRTVQRETVDAIYGLATSVLDRGKNEPPLTKDEIRRTNAYIKRVNNFRTDMYRKIHPSSECAPYVTDDHVKPKSPPYPRIRR